MKIKVKSYTRQSPIKVNRMGRMAEEIELKSPPRLAIADRIERMFKYATLGLSAMVCAWMFASIVIEHLGIQWAEASVIEVPGEQPMPPILRKICHAESGGKQFIKGKVVKHKNTNGTTDYGVCQINSIHLEQAKKMGLDVINSEADNKEFALYLFNTQGSVPWRSSSHIWLKL